MATFILPLHSFTLTIFIMLFTFSTSHGDDDHKYKNCSSSFISCGYLQNVGYPFWGYGRPQYCGHPALQLLCENDGGEENSYPEFGGDGSVDYAIKGIAFSSDKSQMTIQISQDWIINTCPEHSFDKVFNEVFQLKEAYVNITVFHNCSGQDMAGFRNCTIQGRNHETTTYFINYGLQEAPEFCQTTEVPVLVDDLDYLHNKTDSFNRIFEVEYRNYSDCFKCQISNGVCGSHDAEFACFRPKSGQRNLIVGLAIPGVFILIAAGIVSRFLCLWKKGSDLTISFLWKAEAKKYQNIDAFLKIYGSLAPKRYTYAMIRNMTNGFNERLGEGGYAIVYKGKLFNGRLVAVKLLKQSKGNGEDFINEVASICRTNHVNIVTLLGFCFEGKRRALIYDFMSNGSLEKFAYNGAREQALSWETLLNIAVGIAKGLDYLHRGCNARILHFDIKPHNILLDEDFCPKISDFGLARLCPQQESTISMLEARGTIGYIAPEVFCRTISGVSHKSDVYSYGMMILDLVCGRKNLISAEMQRSSELYFPQWIYKRLQQGEEVAIHGIMNDEQKALERKMILVSLWCIQTYPSNRPSMSKVIEMLQGGLELIQLPPDPHLSSPPRMEYCSFETMSLAQ